MPAPIVIAGIVIGVVSLTVGIIAFATASDGRSQAAEGRRRGQTERRRIQRDIQRHARESAASDQQVRQYVRRIATISQIRADFRQACQAEEQNVVAIGSGVYNVWVATCGGPPDYQIAFANDNTSISVQRFDGLAAVTLNDSQVTQVITELRQNGMRCCYMQPVE